jgi:hypothetical protein
MLEARGRAYVIEGEDELFFRPTNRMMSVDAILLDHIDHPRGFMWVNERNTADLTLIES